MEGRERVAVPAEVAVAGHRTPTLASIAIGHRASRSSKQDRAWKEGERRIFSFILRILYCQYKQAKDGLTQRFSCTPCHCRRLQLVSGRRAASSVFAGHLSLKSRSPQSTGGAIVVTRAAGLKRAFLALGGMGFGARVVTRQ